MIPSRYYRILGLNPGAPEREIKRAYRNMAKLYHPDMNPSEAAHHKFLQITEAYEILTGQRTIPRQRARTAHPKSAQQTNSKTPEQERVERMRRTKEYQERKSKAEYYAQQKVFEELNSGRHRMVFQTIRIITLICVSLLILDFILPTKISKHKADYAYDAGTSDLYENEKVTTLIYDNGRKIQVIGPFFIENAENNVFVIERTRLMNEPLRIYLKTNNEFLKHLNSYTIRHCIYNLTPILILLLLIPLITFLGTNKKFFLINFYYLSLVMASVFLLIFLFQDFRILRMIQFFR